MNELTKRSPKELKQKEFDKQGGSVAQHHFSTGSTKMSNLN